MAKLKTNFWKWNINNINEQSRDLLLVSIVDWIENFDDTNVDNSFEWPELMINVVNKKEQDSYVLIQSLDIANQPRLVECRSFINIRVSNNKLLNNPNAQLWLYKLSRQQRGRNKNRKKSFAKPIISNVAGRQLIPSDIEYEIAKPPAFNGKSNKRLYDNSVDGRYDIIDNKDINGTIYSPENPTGPTKPINTPMRVAWRSSEFLYNKSVEVLRPCDIRALFNEFMRGYTKTGQSYSSHSAVFGFRWIVKLDDGTYTRSPLKSFRCFVRWRASGTPQYSVQIKEF